MTNVIRCTRCGKRYRGHGDWNAEFVAGYQVGFICPQCQSTEEDLDAQIQEVLNHPSTWRVMHIGGPNSRYKDNERWIRSLIKTYPTPEIMREKADLLAAARPECREGPVKMMRRIANDMESGELWEDE